MSKVAKAGKIMDVLNFSNVKTCLKPGFNLIERSADHKLQVLGGGDHLYILFIRGLLVRNPVGESL
jgi:hypothetical protein